VLISALASLYGVDSCLYSVVLLLKWLVDLWEKGVSFTPVRVVTCGGQYSNG